MWDLVIFKRNFSILQDGDYSCTIWLADLSSKTDRTLVKIEVPC